MLAEGKPLNHMELLLKREASSAKSTLGKLSIDGAEFCDTLEDVIREVPGIPVDKWKVFGKTAIPAGRYKVILSMSNRFKRVLPLLVDVPGFTGIRIHSGNIAEHTEGCILVGRRDDKPDFVGNSKVTLESLLNRLHKDPDNIWVTVFNP